MHVFMNSISYSANSCHRCTETLLYWSSYWLQASD